MPVGILMRPVDRLSWDSTEDFEPRGGRNYGFDELFLYEEQDVYERQAAGFWLDSDRGNGG